MMLVFSVWHWIHLGQESRAGPGPSPPPADSDGASACMPGPRIFGPPSPLTHIRASQPTQNIRASQPTQESVPWVHLPVSGCQVVLNITNDYHTGHHDASVPSAALRLDRTRARLPGRPVWVACRTNEIREAAPRLRLVGAFPPRKHTTVSFTP